MQASAPALTQEQVIAALPAGLRELARHVLLGSFNRRGKPVGFHHAPNGTCPPGRRIDEVLERFPDGSYRARVSLWRPQRGWVQKRLPSTMFPDTWSSERVMREGLQAYRDRTEEWIFGWRHRSATRTIRGYHRRGRGPTTFFPDMEQER